uniref:Uncharacterized protein n=1 Tax=Oryza punctata TaxID=4537 RepID=A0A0E0LTD8_ORYPU
MYKAKDQQRAIHGTGDGGGNELEKKVRKMGHCKHNASYTQKSKAITKKEKQHDHYSTGGAKVRLSL